jgi:regulator of sirC expression with transglutaminase-like and TPR domain
MGDEILSVSDDKLEIKALQHSLSKKPNIAEHLNKVDFIKAVAKWRHETKTKLLELTQPKEGEGNGKVELTKQEKGQFEIL